MGWMWFIVKCFEWLEISTRELERTHPLVHLTLHFTLTGEQNPEKPPLHFLHADCKWWLHSLQIPMLKSWDQNREPRKQNQESRKQNWEIKEAKKLRAETKPCRQTCSLLRAASFSPNICHFFYESVSWKNEAIIWNWISPSPPPPSSSLFPSFHYLSLFISVVLITEGTVSTLSPLHSTNESHAAFIISYNTSLGGDPPVIICSAPTSPEAFIPPLSLRELLTHFSAGILHQ